MSPLRILVTTLFVSLSLFLIPTATAQSTGTVAGTVIDADTDAPLPGVNVVLRGTERGAATGSDGQFQIAEVASGTYTLEARFLGYRTTERTVEVTAGATVQVQLALTPRSVELDGIEVTALRPDLQPASELEEAAVREANPRDSGELLRSLSGIDAVRRGPVGLDPVVRGLRETEVGVYMDGTRMFPAGPARMDSPMSHFDPTIIESMEVVKGPYALTWGAGNLGAIRVETRGLETIRPGWMHGRVTSGYDTNFGVLESGASITGRPGKVAYRFSGAWREGNDYNTGSGTTIPADFLSREARGKVGYTITPDAQLTVSAGYQNQENIDYPGRLLDANFFNAYMLSVRWTLERDNGLLRGAELLGYVNAVDHGMDNDGKPTAQPMEGRMPPFALDVRINSHMDVVGGRAAAKLAPGGLDQLEVGVDLYSALRDADRTIRRRDDGTLLFEDIAWPNARITDAGLFARAEQGFGAGWRAVGTARLDLARAEAGTVSDFFHENVTRDLTATEANWSGATTLSYTPSPHWTLSLGLGSAVRTADATERYSDRFPSSKAQTSAEFVGTPQLDPERSTQADLWIEAAYPRWTLSVNAFARRLDDYITLAPTELPKRLPLSPETVFRYANGTATFYGGEVSAAYRLVPALTARVTGGYLWGEDGTVGEPVLGAPPLRSSLALRYEPADSRFFAQSTLHLVDEQTRVARTRGETPTDGYTTLDLKGGVDITRTVSLQLGVTNLLDATYVNHLNAKNPFSGHPLPEPGRVFFTDLTVVF